VIAKDATGGSIQYVACRASIDPASSAAEAKQAQELAIYLQARGDSACVDHYYRATLLGWRSIESDVAMSGASQGRPVAWATYQDSLLRLLMTAQQFRRVSPQGELLVETDEGPSLVPVNFYGFAWRPEDFDSLLPARDIRADAVARRYVTPGLGAALVALRISRREEQFFREKQPFAVTAVLRTPQGSTPSTLSSVSSNNSPAVLEFYNPLVFDRVIVAGVPLAIERDLSAPLEFVVRDSPRTFLEGFIEPSESAVKTKLVMYEPYQKGKIPVVFVHGLLSDPQTWYELINDLRAQPDLYARFQFWAFQYPTGGAILESVAQFRQLLALARESSDPNHADPALDQMVLIAHSMGGIVSRLQVTYSYDILWNYAARTPFDTLRAPPDERERIRQIFFFEPSPSIAEVIFIGTPHRGSGWSRRVIGRVSSNLVKFGEQEDSRYRALMHANQDVFYPYLQEKRPTSIDLLEPDNPLLAAYRQLPVNPSVRLHSIIGTGGSGASEPGDGVVPVASARHPCVASELYVPAKHSQLQRETSTVAEVSRILREHAAGSQRATASIPSRKATMASQ